MRVPLAEFRSLPLEVHRILEGVPLHDVSAIDLPGGGPGRTVSDVRALMDDSRRSANAAVHALIALRGWLGRTFHWDDARQKIGAHLEDSFQERVGPEVLRRSTVRPGATDARFHDLYVLEKESLAEIRNATVHAALCVALTDTATGYRLYWGVYVKPITRWTRWYMALIEPFRRFIVYPSVLGRIRQQWQARYASGR